MKTKIDVIASSSGGNAYRLSCGGGNLLIECGIPYRKLLRALDFSLTDIDGVLLSHCHSDHSAATRELVRRGISVYSSAATFEALGLSGHRCRAVKAHEPFMIGGISVYPFDVQHDAPDPLGFVITDTASGERTLFFTDTYYVEYVFSGVDVIMGEVNYSMKTLSADMSAARRERLMTSHMSLEHFLQLLRAYDTPRLKKVYAMHLSDDNSDEEYFRREISRAVSAEVIICERSII